MANKMIPTNLTVEQLLAILQEGTKDIYIINKGQFEFLLQHDGQTFIDNNGEIAILQDFRKNLKIFPKNKKIKILEYGADWN